MKRLTMISFLVAVVCSGCSTFYSPYDLYDWCVRMGSTRVASIGPQAHDRSVCQQQLDEDLADQTPRFLYIPKDFFIDAPIITARAIWTLFGMTTPPF